MKSPAERKRRGMDRSNMADCETESAHGDDVSSMQIQALRSLFLLLVLAVTILVVFSSLAVLRKPQLSPSVNVFVDLASGNGDAARLKRGVAIPLVHTPARREKISNYFSQPKPHEEKGKQKASLGHNKTVTKSVKTNSPEGKGILHNQIDIKHGRVVNRTHKQSENGSLRGGGTDKRNTKRADLATKQESTSSRQPRPSRYNSRHDAGGHGGFQ